MNPPYSSVGAPPLYLMGNKTNPNLQDDLHMGGPDESEVDVLNDETFGDCDLETIKIKSDFGENGEFLGDAPLPDFFGTDAPSSLEALSLNDPDDQSQQPSIDALLGEEPMRIPIGLRSTSGVSTNPLFSMAISQARETNSQGTLFNPPSISRLSPMTVPNPPPQAQAQPQINIAMLKQYEQMLINRQVPAHERLIHLQALIDHLQRQASARPTNPSMMNMNNGHDRMGMGEMMERARRTAMNTEPNLPLSSQLIDAIQRSDQLPLGEVQQKSHSPSSPKETIVSPSHHRHNRPSKFYPRPPMLNTWQGRGPHHDEFAGMMSDLEKQRVVTIQLHQVTQTKDEDFYFQKWSQIRRQMQGTQLNRHDHRGQFIPYPILQLLKSIQQEKELADRLSQSSAQASFGNVNPSQSLPYAMPVQTQLGKQSIATPRHPRCTLHLDGEFTVAARANAITHEKYSLGLRLNIENLYRDLLRAETEEKAEKRDELLRSILQGYLNHPTYLFADMFADVNRGRRLLERLYPLLNSSVEYLEEILVRIYASLSYMIHRYSNTLIIEPIVMNIISSMQKEILPKFNSFEQISRYYTEQIRARLADPSTSPFADPILFTNPYSISILIEFLIWMERRCYLPSGLNSANLPIQILQQLQPQLHYQLTEPVRIVVSEICQALLSCSTPKKMLKPFGQVHHQTFGLLLKFLRIQFSNQVYPTLESKLIYTCVKND